jgi:hypothetical protein
MAAYRPEVRRLQEKFNGLSFTISFSKTMRQLMPSLGSGQAANYPLWARDLPGSNLPSCSSRMSRYP